MPSTPKSDPKRFAQGQASVEVLLVIMLLVTVTFGGIELSRGISVRQALDSSAAAATRALSLDPTQWSFAGSLVQQAVDQNVMGAGPGSSLQLYDAAGNARSSAWLAGSPFGTAFILEASAPFQADIPFLTTSSLSIQVRHWGIVERYP
jgi:hypothetical protein